MRVGDLLVQRLSDCSVYYQVVAHQANGACRAVAFRDFGGRSGGKALVVSMRGLFPAPVPVALHKVPSKVLGKIDARVRAWEAKHRPVDPVKAWRAAHKEEVETLLYGEKPLERNRPALSSLAGPSKGELALLFGLACEALSRSWEDLEGFGVSDGSRYGQALVRACEVMRARGLLPAGSLEQLPEPAWLAKVREDLASRAGDEVS